ncbi:MAG: hypothetical protein M1828_000053 [Chrysothrix sp. TS-e1954]|nr:MAG: hypothetical protein M1828_000053 [Chrysothrix sp. TS-e1954]
MKAVFPGRSTHQAAPQPVPPSKLFCLATGLSTFRDTHGRHRRSGIFDKCKWPARSAARRLVQDYTVKNWQVPDATATTALDATVGTPRYRHKATTDEFHATTGGNIDSPDDEAREHAPLGIPQEQERQQATISQA